MTVDEPGAALPERCLCTLQHLSLLRAFLYRKEFVPGQIAMTEGASTSRAVPVKHDTTANQPWIEKYRPQTLDDVAANKEILGTIKRLTDENRLPHLLLYGPPGLNPWCAGIVLIQRSA